MTIRLKRGVVLGSYELLVKIGQGGMASVWVARERPPGDDARLVAVKTMLPQLSSDPKFRAMFLDEVGLVRSIAHDNVVRLHSTAEDQGLLYMAMEWVEGDSLRAIISEAEKRRPIPPEIAVRIIADAAAGLHAAHELTGWDGELRGVVHCDVSPHNILCGIDGNVKLVDFGVANAMSHTEDDDEVRGKFGYMSPEQARGDPVDRRSDIFSLGIVLFELTTGHRLFLGRDNAHTVKLVKWGKLPRPVDVLPDYPLALEPIVLKALERDPKARFQTAWELRDALERYLVDERILVTKAGVAGLVRRVLGERVERIRAAVRAALEEIDGRAPTADIIPADPVLSAKELSELSIVAEEVSLSRIEATPRGTTGVARLPADDPLSEAAPPAPRSEPPPAESEPPPPPPLASTGPYPAPRAGAPARSLALVLAMLIALIGVIALIAYDNLSAIDDPMSTIAAVATSTQRTPPSSPSSVEPDRDVPISIESLPIGGDSAAVRVETLPVDDSESVTKRKPEPAPRKGIEAAKATGAPTVRRAAEKRPPINRHAMLSALAAAAGSASSCGRTGGPMGRGRASVTFSPNGDVTGVSMSGKFAGTSVGACIARVFRRARVPPFSGSPVTVGRGFVISR